MPVDFTFLVEDPLFSSPFDVGKFRRIIAVFLSELMGTCLFVMFGCASLIATPNIANTIDHTGVSIAFSCAIGMSVWITNHISGSVLNPGLEIALVILGHHSIYRWVLYSLAQFIGGFLGVLINYVVVPDLPSSYCMNARPLGVDPGPALLYEVLGTTLLAWSLCGLIDARRHGSIKHLGIKFVVVVLALLMNVTKLKGSTFNPAKAFGGAMVPMNFDDLWIFVCGPYIGCIVWAFFYRLLFHSDIEEKAEAKQLYNVVE